MTHDDPSTEPSRPPHYPRPVNAGKRLDVQGLRAVAVLLVVAYHGGFGVGGGFTGVDVFFVISGFVITSSIGRELRRTGHISLIRFYGRRAKRLLPGLSLMLLFVAAAGTLLDPVAAQKLTSATGVTAAVFWSNVYLASRPSGYFAVSTQLDPLLHTWTLGVEEQFYLAFPLILIAAWRISRTISRPRPLIATSAAIALVGGASFVAAVYLPATFSYYSSLTRAWEFAAGALLGLYALAPRRLPKLVAVGIGAVGAGLLCLAAVAVAPDEPLLLTTATPAAGAAALILAGCGGDNVLTGLLSIRPLAALGDLSYSWYLWHWPLIVFAQAAFPASSRAAPLAAIASLGPAWLSYHFVENPIRVGVEMQGRRAFVVGLAATAVPLAAFGTVSSVTVPLPTTVYAPGEHVSDRHGCHTYAPIGSRLRGHCEWHVRDAKGSVVLIGDSNAAHFGEAVITADRRAGFDTIIASAPWCPILEGVTLFKDTSSLQVCVDFARGSLNWIVRHRPNLVIISSRSDPWIEDSTFVVERRGRGSPSQHVSSAAKEAAFAQGLRRTVRRLDRAGIPVIVVHPVPEIEVDPGSCAVIRFMIEHSCAEADKRSTVTRRMARTLAAEREAIRGLDATLLDFEPWFCSGGFCRSSKNGALLYRDHQHLSVAGARKLEPFFARAIDRMARPVAGPQMRNAHRRESPGSGDGPMRHTV